MEQFAIVASLKPGAASRARDLVSGGPPFDLRASGIKRHSIYISSGEVVFVFEGHEIEWIVDELIDAPFHYKLQRAFEQWRAILDGPPRIARQHFGWESREAPVADPARERPATARAGSAR